MVQVAQVSRLRHKARAARFATDRQGGPLDWSIFEQDSDPISIQELLTLPLAKMPKRARIAVFDNDFPDTTVSREGKQLVCEIEEHLYTKYWEHKFSAYAFAEAMERAVRRLAHEGHPFAAPTRDDDDVHIFVRWQLRLPRDTQPSVLVESIRAAFDLVWQRADSILENSDSVLVLGKDTGEALERLKRIAAQLEAMGYFTYIIKEQADRAGEGVIQKVLRYALSSKFVIVENTDASGHLYEFSHVSKTAECVTVVLQEAGKGATWMFEDGYAKHRHWHKQEYNGDNLERAVEEGAKWAEAFVSTFAAYQRATLPWMRGSV